MLPKETHLSEIKEFVSLTFVKPYKFIITSDLHFSLASIKL
jgi:hypothetical protein